MREIKFRAWHKPTNQFVRCHPVWNDRHHPDLGLLSLTSDGELIFETMYDGFQRLSSSNEVDDFIVQQYTGLKDKNGVEIYEGDIIQFKNWCKEYIQAEVKYGIGEFDGGVYKYAGFYLEGDGEILEPCEITNMIEYKEKFPEQYSYEVIGNIFEGVDK